LRASVPDIIVLVSRKYLALIMVGVLIASPVAWLLMRKWLMHFAFRTGINWWIFVVAGVAALLIAAVTVSYQVIRVAMVNPIKSLRTECSPIFTLILK